MLLPALFVVGACGFPAPIIDAPRLALPPYIYAIEGTALDIYRDNLVLSYQSSGAPYVPSFSGVSGTLSSSKWSRTFGSGSSGAYDLTVIESYGAVQLESGGASVRVSDGAVASTKVVLVGDSLTDNSVYPPALDALTPAGVTYLGTQTDGGVANEGYTGEYWCWFSGNASSPFRNAGAIDIPHYLGVIGSTPDVVVWMLGVNSVFTGTLSANDSTVATELACADSLISAWRTAAPNTIHGVVIVTPGNKDDNTYFVNYSPPINTEWTWRRKNHREVEIMLQHWVGDGTGGVYLVPANVAIDRVNGYPNDNAVHPNSTGYGQIASQVYAWLAYVR